MMYRITLDGKIIHDLHVKNLVIINPKLTITQNAIGQFEFTIYNSNFYYDKFVKMKSIVTVYRSNEILFRGRVIEIEENTNKARTIYCEEDTAYLLDTLQEPYEWNGSVKGLFDLVIEKHNTNCEEEKQFKVGNVTVTDPNNYIVRADSTYMTTWETIQKKFIELLGGYIVIRHESDGRYIDYLADFDTLNSQHVTFGENMLTVKTVEDVSDIATVLIPLGATDETTSEPLNVASVNGGSIYVEDSQGIAKYGRIIKTKTWDDVTIPDNLLRKAKQELAEILDVQTVIEISALDMASINKDISNFKMYSKIKVTSQFHDLDDYFIPQKMTINLFNQANNKITLNGTISTITSSGSDNTAKVDTIIQTVEKINANYAIGIPTQLLNLKQQLASEIEQSANAIYLEVSEQYYNKSQSDELISDVGTSLEQTKSYFEMNFNSFTQELSDVLNNTNARYEDIKKYIRFEDGNIILGEVGNEFMMIISKKKISFMQGTQEVAYISNSKLYITFVEVLHSLQIGKFAFIPRANGNLTFKKV